MAFTESFKLGFGVETDIRDRNADLVIAHDMAASESIPLEDFILCYKQTNNDAILALNIKADGLTSRLKEYLEQHNITNYFVFDMSIPDTLHYLKAGMPVFIRQSEYEKDLPFYNQARGIWLDMFESEWVTEEIVTEHLRRGKAVCLVSPELHQRSKETLWDNLKTWKCLNNPDLYLCTDLPEEGKLKILDEAY